MFWTFVGRILLARWLIIALVTLCSLAGGAYVVATADREYDASARVMLLVYKPDPITGRMLDKKTIDPYLQTQLNLIRSFQVVGPAIEAVGWLDDPDVQESYRASGDPRPLELWIAQALIAKMQVNLVDGSNIVKITFRGRSPEAAEMVAGAIRDAYVNAAVQERRYGATSEAEYQAERSERIRSELLKLEAQKRALEAETGIILPAHGKDLDTARLDALATPPKVTGLQDVITPSRASSSESLIAVDAELAQASKVLGPNHPRLAQLKATRAVLASMAAREQNMSAEVSSIVLSRERVKQAQFEAQRTKVLDQRQDLLRLRLVQDQINFKTKALEASTEQLAHLRTLTTTTESGLVPVGKVESSETQTFPNVPLILGGTGGIGLVAGIIIALLVEMLNLRVRTPAGLRIATNTRVLGSVPDVRRPHSATGARRFGVRKLRPATA